MRHASFQNCFILVERAMFYPPLLLEIGENTFPSSTVDQSCIHVPLL